MEVVSQEKPRLLPGEEEIGCRCGSVLAVEPSDIGSEKEWDQDSHTDYYLYFLECLSCGEKVYTVRWWKLSRYEYARWKAENAAEIIKFRQAVERRMR